MLQRRLTIFYNFTKFYTSISGSLDQKFSEPIPLLVCTKFFIPFKNVLKWWNIYDLILYNSNHLGYVYMWNFHLDMEFVDEFFWQLNLLDPSFKLDAYTWHGSGLKWSFKIKLKQARWSKSWATCFWKFWTSWVIGKSSISS